VNAKEAAEALAVRVESQTAVAKPLPTPADMLQAVIQGGVTQENVAAVKEIVGLYERMEDRRAAKTASQALRELQTEAKSIAGTKGVPDKQGNIKYKYAPYEEIMAKAQPLLTKYGFSVRFSQKMESDRTTVTCILTHDDGHAFTNEFTVRVGSGPPNATAPQADAGAGTTAQREAFCDALNIVRCRDDDAHLVGAPITKDQADELERRVHETNSDKAAFLKLAGAATFAEIGSVKYEMLDQLLQRKEKRGK
jgi:hypothetical protein